MSAFDRVMEDVREVLLAAEDIRRLSENVKALAIEVREIDRRLVRIETLAGLAKPRARPARKRMPAKQR